MFEEGDNAPTAQWTAVPELAERRDDKAFSTVMYGRLTLSDKVMTFFLFLNENEIKVSSLKLTVIDIQ